jgi:hypothetical protein
MAKYLVTVWGDVEPAIEGPFPTAIARNKAAARFKMKEEGGVFKLDIDERGKPAIDSYSCAEMDKLTGGETQ